MYRGLTSWNTLLQAERVDERGDDLDNPLPPTDPFILSSVAYALYTTIESTLQPHPLSTGRTRKTVVLISPYFFEALNRPLSRPAAIMPVEVIRALERKTQSTIKRDQQVRVSSLPLLIYPCPHALTLSMKHNAKKDAQELFQIISHALSSEEELQYREEAPSLLDVGMLKKGDPVCISILSRLLSLLILRARIRFRAHQQHWITSRPLPCLQWERWDPCGAPSPCPPLEATCDIDRAGREIHSPDLLPLK